MEKKQILLVGYAILLLVLLFGLVKIFINGQGTFFVLEFLGLLFLMLLVLLGFVFSKKRHSFFFLFFIFYLLNLVLLWYFRREIYIVLFVLAFLGIILSLLPRPRSKASSVSSKEPHSEVFDAPIRKDSTVKGNVKPDTNEKKPVLTPSVQHIPGKYVASSRSNIYHLPKCDWAKKIQKDRRIWFAEKAEAWEKGYKAHNCV